ncbi:hypothetical protein D1970_07835 [Mesobacillus zeae]|uniref:Uncharacterized protein n=1 Tax=Mesobacillus zeae TaxID=1917180 RepID=A0A398BAY5_9BACI|nr:hypothetical protein D1970_07835 [Mesobacillus zeae]
MSVSIADRPPYCVGFALLAPALALGVLIRNLLFVDSYFKMRSFPPAALNRYRCFHSGKSLFNEPRAPGTKLALRSYAHQKHICTHACLVKRTGVRSLNTGPELLFRRAKNRKTWRECSHIFFKTIKFFKSPKGFA